MLFVKINQLCTDSHANSMWGYSTTSQYWSGNLHFQVLLIILTSASSITSKRLHCENSFNATELEAYWNTKCLTKSEINLHELLKNVLCCTLGTNDVSNRESNSPKLTKEMCKVMGNTLQCCIKFKCWCIMMTWHEDMKVLRWTDMKIWRWTVKNAKNAH